MPLKMMSHAENLVALAEHIGVSPLSKTLWNETAGRMRQRLDTKDK